MKYVTPLLFLLLVIVGIKASDWAYRAVRYGPEREQVRRMRRDLVDAGAVIVRTREDYDSMRAALRATDDSLAAEFQAVRRYNDYAEGGALPQDVYDRYRADLDRYNAHVELRNQRLSAWRDVADRNSVAVSRYNLLADSIRDLATRIGDPYFAVPTPAEAAIERGVIRPVQ
jgi:hypothetical protein